MALELLWRAGSSRVTINDGVTVEVGRDFQSDN